MRRWIRGARRRERKCEEGGGRGVEGRVSVERGREGDE